MDQKQKNDSETVSPTRDDSAGCGALAGLFVFAFILLCAVGYFLGDAVGHDPFILSICAAAVIVFCAAVGVCLSREQKGGQNRKNSEALWSDPQICPPPESGVKQSGFKACSSILDFCVPLSTVCLFIVVLFWLNSILGRSSLGLTKQGYIITTSEYAIMAIPLLVLRGIAVDRKRKREQKRNNAEAQPRDIPTAISRGCAAAVGLFWFITASLCWGVLLRYPGHDPLLSRFIDFTELCVFVVLPLLILWRIFAYRKYRREQNRR